MLSTDAQTGIFYCIMFRIRIAYLMLRIIKERKEAHNPDDTVLRLPSIMFGDQSVITNTFGSSYQPYSNHGYLGQFTERDLKQ